ncbi:hypothetical protein ACFU8I_00605 [Streptomyces sp. NPDC057540]|uniref:hypothetical protein n=1 Tax=Streptomyces sp. NPDC057540 TaxID=3346160 RepID=UPI0036BC6926
MAGDPEDDTLELPPVPRWGRGRPRLAAHRIHPRRLAAGHRQLLARTAAWPLAGRISGAAFGSLMAWRTAHDQPRTLAIAVGTYAVAAWRAGRPVPPVPPTEDELKHRFLLGIQHLIGDRPGIHVRELYASFQARSAAAHLDDTRLRALLVRCKVPLQQIRLGDQGGRIGIKATDITTLLSPTPVDTPSEAVDAGQGIDATPVEQTQKGRRPPQKEFFMATDRHDITIRGRITLPGNRFVTCPECGTADELTLYGPDGGAGNLMCPDGHHFAPPAPVDPVDLLARAVADPRTEFLG